MAGGRRTKPLFDLLPEALGKSPPEGVHTVPRESATLSELKPRVAVRPVPQPQASPHTPGDAWSAAMLSNGTVRLRANMLYLLVAAWILSLLAVWLVGNWWGAKGKERELEPLLQRGPTPNDPLTPNVSAPGSNRPVGVVAPDVTPSKPAAKPITPIVPGPTNNQPALTGDPSQTPYIVSTGRASRDPRTPGLNYLVLATVPEEEAARAVRFLSDNALNAVGVPAAEVDRRGASAKDSRYRLVVLTGITGAEYRDASPVRTRLEADVRRLGQTWQQDHRGSTNFGRPGWEKFQP
ncbi:MAG: hypothetical protein FJ255_05190 [Phycisphaerae bacterium]|nr:hypothetical protein [Phycisphaerae bacterium]